MALRAGSLRQRLLMYYGFSQASLDLLAACCYCSIMLRTYGGVRGA